MLKSFDGKKVLVTGAASGIGRATAIECAKLGAEVFLTDINEAGLRDTVREITESGGSVSFSRTLDISDHTAVQALATDVHVEFGALDAVMNIAGTSIWGTVETLQHEHWRRMIDINLMGPIHVIEYFVPAMIAAKRGGAIVNVSSAAGLLALPWHAAYSASKFGLRGLSEVLRFDLKQHKISVHLVAPGAVKTPLVESMQIAGVDKDDPKVRKYVGLFERHAISPEEAAEAIVRGVVRNDFLIYTSFDIRFGYWWARKFALPYEIVMQQANNVMSKAFAKAPRPPTP